MRTLLVLLLASSALPLGSTSDLRWKYGSPISQTFAVRPGIGVTVRQAPNGDVIELLIIPITLDGLMESRHLRLTQDGASSVLDELVPSSRRGKYIVGTFLNDTCLPEDDCWGSSASYENVEITFNSAREPGKLRYVDVQFKGKR